MEHLYDGRGGHIKTILGPTTFLGDPNGGVQLSDELNKIATESDGLQILLPHRKGPFYRHSPIELEDIGDVLVGQKVVPDSHLTIRAVPFDEDIVDKGKIKDDITMIAYEEICSIPIDPFQSAVRETIGTLLQDSWEKEANGKFPLEITVGIDGMQHLPHTFCILLGL